MQKIVEWKKEALNRAIQLFSQVSPIIDEMTKTFDGISQMVMLDRYSFKDTMKETLEIGGLVNCSI